MSLLHRSVLAQIMTAIDPILEVGLSVVNPAVGAGSKLILTDLENIVGPCDDAQLPAPAQRSGLAPAPAQAPTQTLPTGYVSPLPTATAAAQNQPTEPAAVAAPQSAPAPAPTGQTGASAAAAAPAPLSAHDVIAALMQTLQSLEART